MDNLSLFRLLCDLQEETRETIEEKIQKNNSSPKDWFDAFLWYKYFSNEKNSYMNYDVFISKFCEDVELKSLYERLIPVLTALKDIE